MYDKLTDNQKLGIAKNAKEFNLTPEAYCMMRLEQDGDRGYRALVETNTLSINTKMRANPDIIAELEEIADVKIAVLEVGKMEAAELAKEPVEEPIIEGIVKG